MFPNVTSQGPIDFTGKSGADSSGVFAPKSYAAAFNFSGGGIIMGLVLIAVVIYLARK